MSWVSEAGWWRLVWVAELLWVIGGLPPMLRNKEGNATKQTNQMEKGVKWLKEERREELNESI